MCPTQEKQGDREERETGALKGWVKVARALGGSVGWVNPAETVSEGRQKGPKEGSTLLGHWREAKVRNAFRLPKGPGYS